MEETVMGMDRGTGRPGIQLMLMDYCFKEGATPQEFDLRVELFLRRIFAVAS
jgi:hypothetical protein